MISRGSVRKLDVRIKEGDSKAASFVIDMLKFIDVLLGKSRLSISSNVIVPFDEQESLQQFQLLSAQFLQLVFPL